jgi:hypothetical protein
VVAPSKKAGGPEKMMLPSRKEAGWKRRLWEEAGSGRGSQSRGHAVMEVYMVHGGLLG